MMAARLGLPNSLTAGHEHLLPAALVTLGRLGVAEERPRQNVQHGLAPESTGQTGGGSAGVGVSPALSTVC